MRAGLFYLSSITRGCLLIFLLGFGLQISPLGWAQSSNAMGLAAAEHVPSAPKSEKSQLPESLLQVRLEKSQPLPVDLSLLLQLVDEQNLPIQQADLRYKRAGNQTLLSYSRFLPNIELNYLHSRFQGGRQIFGNQILNIFQTTINPQISARWTVYPGGRDIYNSLAARRRQRAAKLDLTQSWQQELSTTAVKYHQWLGAQLYEFVAKSALKASQELVKVNNARYQVGVGTKLELMQAQAQQSQRERDVFLALQLTGTLEQQLLQQVNLDPDVYLGLSPQALKQLSPQSLEALFNDQLPLEVFTAMERPLLKTPSSEALPSIKRLLVYARQHHPSLLRIAAEKKALQAEVGVTRSDILPSVDLSTYVGWGGSHWDSLALQRFGGFNIQANLLDNLGTSLPLRIRERMLAVRQNELLFEQEIRTIETKLTQSYLQILEAEKSIHAAKDEVEAASESSRLAEARYKAGVGVQLDVLESQSRLATARRSLVEAIVRLNEGHIRLLEALGEASPKTLVDGWQMPDTQADASQSGA
ncbi:MAG: TolC family protein [Vampirovibrionales bacterium]|nr:TolC family protein [Vampirovibrionales bacterium]